MLHFNWLPYLVVVWQHRYTTHNQYLTTVPLPSSSTSPWDPPRGQIANTRSEARLRQDIVSHEEITAMERNGQSGFNVSYWSTLAEVTNDARIANRE